MVYEVQLRRERPLLEVWKETGESMGDIIMTKLSQGYVWVKLPNGKQKVLKLGR